MKNQWIAVVAIAMLALAYLLVPNTNVQQDKNLLPEFASWSQKIHAITLAQQQKTSLELVQKDGVFQAKNYHNYAVDAAKVRALMLQLKQLEIIEPKTAKADNYHYLGLDEVQRQVLTLTDEQGKTLINLHLGKEGKNGRFARLPDQAQSYLVNWRNAMELDALQWISRSFIDIEASNIIRISNQNGMVLSRSDAEQALALQNVAAEAELKQYEVSRLSSLLSDWEFLGVQPLVEPLDFATQQVKVELAEDKKLVLALGQNQEKFWLQIHADTTAVAVAPWLYEISQYDYELLTANLDFFLVKADPETTSQ